MSPQRYRWPRKLDDIEDVERYRPGGFHPLHIGDLVDGRYKVLHKLGCGGFSTVWLARNLVDHKLCALKILAADAPQIELDILLYLLNSAGPHPNILTVLDHFAVSGPFGSHPCFVMPVLGPSVKQISRAKIALPSARDASRQIACGLAYIHRAGICHGDFTDGNVLFGLRDVANWTDAEVYRHLGAPQKEPLLLLNGSPAERPAPREIVEAIDFQDIDTSLVGDTACIVDFGLAFRTGSPPPGIPGTPRSFLAPELCFGAVRSPTNDVWGLGCLIYQIYTSRVLTPLVFDQLDLVIGTIVDTLGRLPPHWEGHFVNQEERILEPGQKDFWYDPSFKPNRPIGRFIDEQCSQLSEQEKEQLRQLLAGALSLDPCFRLSAAEIAEHAFLQPQPN